VSTAAALDEKTVATIRAAVEAASKGRLDEACRIGEQGLAGGGDRAALNAMLGSFHCRAGNVATGIEFLREARSARPDDPVIAVNLGAALTELGEYRQLLDDIPERLAARDPSMRLYRLRGFAAQSLEDFTGAIAAYEKVVAAQPRDWETWNNLGNTRVDAGDLQGGIEALRTAARLNPAASKTRFNLTQTLRAAGAPLEAAAELQALAADFPSDPTPLGHLFGLLQEQGWDAEAQEALEQAIERDPTNVGMLIALGRQHLLTFSFDEADRVFRRVIEIEPANGDAYLGLADIAEHQEPGRLPDILAEATAAGIDENRANSIRAMVALRQKKFAEGANAIDKVPGDFDPVRVWHLKGRLLDGLGQYDKAFEAYSRMNEALAAEPTKPLERAAELRGQLRGHLERTTAQWRESWSAPAFESSRPSPVFLVGFPRSGTTLLDTMLMGHPDVEVMEERPVIARIRAETGGFDSIAAMDEAEVRRLQDRYFELAAQYAELREGALLVDKSPLHMQSVPLIRRLFPNARFILALRHPADVVLSCFMAKFRMNASMSNFVSLDTTAEFYDLSFAMWERAADLLQVEVHRVVYEEMIENPEAALRPIVEGLGLDWRPEVIDHERTAASRGIITTASYDQVTQPLYRSSAGRWQKYRKHLEPVLPVLRPWAEKFGYSV
jgi:tetratricopeptide (TPR) repeat protein